jgi:hypothetical protein
LLLCSSYLPLGVPNWTVKNYQHRTASEGSALLEGSGLLEDVVDLLEFGADLLEFGALLWRMASIC